MHTRREMASHRNNRSMIGRWLHKGSGNNTACTGEDDDDTVTGTRSIRPLLMQSSSSPDELWSSLDKVAFAPQEPRKLMRQRRSVTERSSPVRKRNPSGNAPIENSKLEPQCIYQTSGGMQRQAAPVTGGEHRHSSSPGKIVELPDVTMPPVMDAVDVRVSKTQLHTYPHQGKAESCLPSGSPRLGRHRHPNHNKLANDRTTQYQPTARASSSGAMQGLHMSSASLDLDDLLTDDDSPGVQVFRHQRTEADEPSVETFHYYSSSLPLGDRRDPSPVPNAKSQYQAVNHQLCTSKPVNPTKTLNGKGPQKPFNVIREHRQAAASGVNQPNGSSRPSTTSSLVNPYATRGNVSLSQTLGYNGAESEYDSTATRSLTSSTASSHDVSHMSEEEQIQLAMERSLEDECNYSTSSLASSGYGSSSSSIALRRGQVDVYSSADSRPPHGAHHAHNMSIHLEDLIQRPSTLPYAASVSSSSQDDYRAIQSRQHDTSESGVDDGDDTSEAATLRLAESEQEREMLELALERSLSDSGSIMTTTDQSGDAPSITPYPPRTLPPQRRYQTASAVTDIGRAAHHPRGQIAHLRQHCSSEHYRSLTSFAEDNINDAPLPPPITTAPSWNKAKTMQMRSLSSFAEDSTIFEAYDPACTERICGQQRRYNTSSSSSLDVIVYQNDVDKAMQQDGGNTSGVLGDVTLTNTALLDNQGPRTGPRSLLDSFERLQMEDEEEQEKDMTVDEFVRSIANNKAHLHNSVSEILPSQQQQQQSHFEALVQRSIPRTKSDSTASRPAVAASEKLQYRWNGEDIEKKTLLLCKDRQESEAQRLERVEREMLEYALAKSLQET